MVPPAGAMTSRKNARSSAPSAFRRSRQRRAQGGARAPSSWERPCQAASGPHARAPTASSPPCKTGARRPASRRPAICPSRRAPTCRDRLRRPRRAAIRLGAEPAVPHAAGLRRSGAAGPRDSPVTAIIPARTSPRGAALSATARSLAFERAAAQPTGRPYVRPAGALEIVGQLRQPRGDAHRVGVLGGPAGQTRAQRRSTISPSAASGRTAPGWRRAARWSRRRPARATGSAAARSRLGQRAGRRRFQQRRRRLGRRWAGSTGGSAARQRSNISPLGAHDSQLAPLARVRLARKELRRLFGPGPTGSWPAAARPNPGTVSSSGRSAIGNS